MSDISKIAQNTMQQAGVHTITIKDKQYTIELLPAISSLAIATQIFKVVLPALGAYGDASRREGLVLPEEDDLYTQVALLLVGQLDKVSVVELVQALTQNIKSNGVNIDVDKEFRGNLGGLLILIEFILKENIGPLLEDWLKEKGLEIPSVLSQNTPKADTSK